ncbi:hypothetical protein CK489_39920 [Bradyrhizobium sp. UFLA03-84]|nr:hypothetical protein CK489_39920 [Bradyrhizobium sp. UFLA03-84]
MDRPANAACTPAAGNDVTANCTGTTTNQGGGAPGTSAQSIGYGTGSETGININVEAGSTLSGTSAGISIHDGTVTNGSNLTLIGSTSTIWGQGTAITASGNLTVNNEASGLIYTVTGGSAIRVNGIANINNSGVISGSFFSGVTVAGGFASADASLVTLSGFTADPVSSSATPAQSAAIIMRA